MAFSLLVFVSTFNSDIEKNYKYVLDKIDSYLGKENIIMTL